MAQRVCRYCGQFFNIKVGALNKGEGQFCSKSCWQASRTELLECPVCHKHIVVGVLSKKQFCSRECSNEWRRMRSKKVMRHCDTCGVEYAHMPGDPHRAKYCSKACFLKAWYKYVPQECEYCGRTYKPDHEGQRFCSVTCRLKSRRKVSRTRRCKKCQKVFRITDSRRKYCSRLCSALAHRGENHHWGGGQSDVRYPSIKTPIKAGTNRKRYTRIHCLVMEAYLGRPLDFYGTGHGNNEVVHHLDGNSKNFKIWNLELCLAREHRRYHANEAIRRKKLMRN